MFPFVLSVLLMGMLPVAGSSTAPVRSLSVAAPAVLSVRSETEARLDALLSASGFLVSDLDSGQELYGRDIDAHRAIASLTKLMTAIVIVERHSLDEVVEIPGDVAMVEGQVARLRAGDHYTVGDLLSAMLVFSANDAAMTLATYDAGSVDAFVKQMNDRAITLGLRNTAFANPIGLDDPRQYSTPQDLKWLATYALRYPAIVERMGTPLVTVRSREGDAITLHHTHALLGSTSSVIAGKTGTTDEAKQTLVSVVRVAGRKYLVILLGSSERYRDMRIVLNTLAKLAV